MLKVDQDHEIISWCKNILKATYLFEQKYLLCVCVENRYKMCMMGRVDDLMGKLWLVFVVVPTHNQQCNKRERCTAN